MKKILLWLKSPASDVFLFLFILILLNLSAARCFFRLDVTSQNVFSLSGVSKELVRSLEEPLSVNVFFSDGLPAPYNSAGQYLADLLAEYQGNSSGNFSCTFFDMDKPESQDLARSYGVSQVQIQEFSDNELGFKNAYMGVAVTYRDRIEVINQIASEEGLEYKLTSLFSRMIAESNTLEGLDGKIEMRLYATDALSAFGIRGFDDLKETVLGAYTKLNAENMERISFSAESPEDADAVAVASRYGLQYLTWENPSVSGGTSSGVIGLVLEYGDNFRTVPLRLVRSLFGGYGVSGMDALEENLSTALKSLVSKTLAVGYVTGHGEVPLSAGSGASSAFSNDANAANFVAIASDRYTFEDVRLAENPALSRFDCLVINGPKTAFSEEELYRLDQFLMGGGNLMVFLDSFDIMMPQGQQAYYMQPQFVPVRTGVEDLLAKYGVSVGKNYVLDTKCYEDVSMRGAPGSSLYYIPVVERSGMNQSHPISKNLSYVLFLQASEIAFIADDVAGLQENAVSGEGGVSKTVLAKSSPESWIADDPASFAYVLSAPPSSETETKARNLAVLLEGVFSSAYASPPVASQQEGSASENDAADGASGGNADGVSSGGVKASGTHLSAGVRRGRIFVAGSSAITTQSVIDENGTQPIAVFLRNALDYLNGTEEFCVMRTKGMSLNTLEIKQGTSTQVAKIFNQYGLPALVAVAGLFAWKRRSSRRREIRKRYASAHGNASGAGGGAVCGSEDAHLEVRND